MRTSTSPARGSANRTSSRPMGRPNSCRTAALIASGESSRFPSPGERPQRQSAHGRLHKEYGTCGRGRIGPQIDPRGGDVELVFVGPTERTCRHQVDREFYYRVEPPVIRSISVHRMTAPKGHPDAAVRIECDPVRQARVAADPDKWPPIPRYSVSRVVVEEVDSLRRRIDVEHSLAVAAPGDPVGYGDRFERSRHLSGRAAPIKGTAWLDHVVRHGSAKESALPIDATIVHTASRVRERGVLCTYLPIGLDYQESTLDCDNKAAVGPWPNCCGHLRDVKPLH